MKTNMQRIGGLCKRTLYGMRAPASHAKVIGLLCLMSTFGLSGCHLSWPFGPPASLVDNARFMDMWNTYQHCRMSADPGEIRADLEKLNAVSSHVVSEQNRDSVWLPVPIQALMTALPSRLAVDPYAMTAACAQHGSQVAQSAEPSELSRELLTTVAMVTQSPFTRSPRLRP